MTIEQTISQISKLPVEEQLQIIHTIWDRMGDNAVPELTDSQRKELDERMKRFRENPESAMTESELRDRLRNRREGS